MPKKDNRIKVKNNNYESNPSNLSDMSSTDNAENIMDTGVEVSAPVNPDLVIAPQPNEGDKLKQVFSEAELLGIKEYCRVPKLQSLWTTLVLT